MDVLFGALVLLSRLLLALNLKIVGHVFISEVF